MSVSFGIRKHSFFSFFSIYYSLGVCTGSYVYNSLTGGPRVVVFFQVGGATPREAIKKSVLTILLTRSRL